LRDALEQVADAVKSIPAQVKGFVSDPNKGGFVADLATVPLAAGTIALAAESGVHRAVASTTNRAIVRAQVAAFNNPVQSFAMGLGLGYAGVPVPQGFGPAMKAGGTVGKVLEKVVKVVQAIY
jgi:hypothetical protein